jgi:hypothetical protein
MKIVNILAIALLSLIITAPASAAGQGSKNVSKQKASNSKRAANIQAGVRAGTDPKSLARLVMSDTVSVGPVHADKSKKVFYWPGCSKFEKVSLKDRLIFGDDEEAEKSGYKPAGDCRQQ